MQRADCELRLAGRAERLVCASARPASRGTWPSRGPCCASSATNNARSPSGDRAVAPLGDPAGITSSGEYNTERGEVSLLGADQLGLGRRELLVGQDALLVQSRQLIQLVDNGRSARRGRRGRRFFGACCGGACCCCSRSLMRASWSASASAAAPCSRAALFPTMYAPPPTTAARISGRRRLNITYLLRSPGRTGVLHVIRQVEAEGDHELGAASTSFGPPTCGAMAMSTPMMSSGVAPSASAVLTCQT